MLAIIGGRQTGKSSALIEMSHETGIPILTATEEMTRHIKRQADFLCKGIPQAMTVREFLTSRKTIVDRDVLVDDIGALVEGLICARVVAATIDGLAIVKAPPSIISPEGDAQ